MREISFEVEGYPPAKNEAKSMLAAAHIYAERVLALLRAARDALPAGAVRPLFGDEPLGLEFVVAAPERPPSDATNYFGGVADVLEAKGRRGVLEHLGELAMVELYDNDRQVEEVHYRYERDAQPRYAVRIWKLNKAQARALVPGTPAS